MWLIRERNVPFIFQSVSQFEDFDFNIALPVMLQDFFVGLSLSVLEGLEVGGIGFELVPRFEMCKITLNVARRTAAARSAEAHVGQHGL